VEACAVHCTAATSAARITARITARTAADDLGDGVLGGPRIVITVESIALRCLPLNRIDPLDPPDRP
jgi:hypothetical protein